MFFRFSLFLALVATACGVTLKEIKVSTQGAVTPIMGWSSWNNYRIHINDSIIRNQADAMVRSGMAEAGYSFINIDDGYFLGRDEKSRLLYDDVKFPNGMKSLADHIHAKGLKAGIYTDAGENTCGSIWDADKNGIGVGVFGHEHIDFPMFFNEWGYDFIKIDWCGGQQQKLDEESVYSSLIHQVKETRKDVVFNICRWQFPGTWACAIADSWRISGDINASFGSICHIIDKNMFLAPYASPGHFNDMDMLQVGRGMTADEDKAHFTMWCMMASPLLAGNDLAQMSEETRMILTNKEIIALNQDPAGLQAEIVARINGVEMWVKHLVQRNGRERAVTLLNRSETPVTVTIDFAEAGLKDVKSVRDLWEHQEKQVTDNKMTVEVPAHGVRALRAVASDIIIPSRYEAEYGFINNLGRKDGPQFVAVNDFSGNYGVKGLGGDAGNSINFRYVLSEKNKSVNIIAASDNNIADTALLEVNGQKCKRTSENQWEASFNEGYNTILIYDAENQLPTLDYISIENID